MDDSRRRPGSAEHVSVWAGGEGGPTRFPRRGKNGRCRRCSPNSCSRTASCFMTGPGARRAGLRASRPRWLQGDHSNVLEPSAHNDKSILQGRGRRARGPPPQCSPTSCRFRATASRPAHRVALLEKGRGHDVETTRQASCWRRCGDRSATAAGCRADRDAGADRRGESGPGSDGGYRRGRSANHRRRSAFFFVFSRPAARRSPPLRGKSLWPIFSGVPAASGTRYDRRVPAGRQSPPPLKSGCASGASKSGDRDGPSPDAGLARPARWPLLVSWHGATQPRPRDAGGGSVPAGRSGGDFVVGGAGFARHVPGDAMRRLPRRGGGTWGSFLEVAS